MLNNFKKAVGAVWKDITKPTNYRAKLLAVCHQIAVVEGVPKKGIEARTYNLAIDFINNKSDQGRTKSAWENATKALESIHINKVEAPAYRMVA